MVTTCSARNVDLCKRLSAGHVVDYTKGTVVDSMAKIAAENDLAVNNVAKPRISPTQALTIFVLEAGPYTVRDLWFPPPSQRSVPSLGSSTKISCLLRQRCADQGVPTTASKR